VAVTVSGGVHVRVVELLRSLQEARELWDGGAAGGGVRLMPSAWHDGSYAELERVLHLMRDTQGPGRQLWASVCARYIWTTQRIAKVSVIRTRQGPVPLPPPGSEVQVVLEMKVSKARVRLSTWDSRVDERLVGLGVNRLAQLMYGGDHGRVVLPRYLRERALA
jgi:hypothetical protein